ncbi:MAG: hypothetical protein C0517_06655 [Erythrobacter sp.]|nr:hypothetical protein [Erythrobacter sp.]
MTHTRHPNALAALCIIRNKPEGHPRSAISSLALFTVTRRGRREADFQLEHRFFDPTHTRAEILDGVIQRIPPGAELLIRQAGPAPHMMRHQSDGQLQAVPPTDTQIFARALKGSTIIAIHVRDRELSEAGASLGFDMPGPDSTPIRRRRRAPLHAQALWALYTTAFCPPVERRTLFSAHLAWRALQRARLGVGAG